MVVELVLILLWRDVGKKCFVLSSNCVTLSWNIRWNMSFMKELHNVVIPVYVHSLTLVGALFCFLLDNIDASFQSPDTKQRTLYYIRRPFVLYLFVSEGIGVTFKLYARRFKGVQGIIWIGRDMLLWEEGKTTKWITHYNFSQSEGKYQIVSFIR